MYGCLSPCELCCHADAQNVRLGLYQQSQEHISAEVSATGRIEVLPVQWRKQLNLQVELPPGPLSVWLHVLSRSCMAFPCHPGDTEIVVMHPGIFSALQKACATGN